MPPESIATITIWALIFTLVGWWMHDPLWLSRWRHLMDANQQYAVFESIGDDWNQITYWISHEAATKQLKSWRAHHPDRHFELLQRHIIQT